MEFASSQKKKREKEIELDKVETTRVILNVNTISEHRIDAKKSKLKIKKMSLDKTEREKTK